MRHFLLVLWSIWILIVSLSGMAFGQNIAIGEWQIHVPYKNAKSIAANGDRIYCAANVSLFSYDKTDKEIYRYDKVTGLSDVGVSKVGYSDATDILVITYEDANIDLIKNNRIINISDIKRKSISGEKGINHLFFLNDNVYLSTGFGIVVLDLIREEINDTYYIGDGGGAIRVNGLCSSDGKFFAATEEGVKAANINTANLANFQEWAPFGVADGLPAGSASHIVAFENAVYASLQDSIFYFDGSQWNFFTADTSWTVQNLNASGGYLIASERSLSGTGSPGGGRLLMWNGEQGQQQIDSDPTLASPVEVIVDDAGIIWVADLYAGLLRIEPGKASGRIEPEGPFTTSIAHMSYGNGQLWVAPGGVDETWDYTFSHEGFYGLKDGKWQAYNPFNTPALDTILNIYDVAVNPYDGKVYFASYFNGLLEFDESTSDIKVFDQYNSTLQYVPGDNLRTRISGLAVDNDGNVWMSNFAAVDAPLAVKKTDGTTKSFKPLSSVGGNFVSDIVIDDDNQKWVVIPGKNNSQGLLVFNHGDDIDDITDDQYKIYTAFQDGDEGIPSNDVLSIAKDKEGEVWVGTAEGLGIFYCPGEVFVLGCEAQRILVEQDGFNAYLLENEQINAIEVDGGNRKWIGTNNGVWLLSPDGLEELLYFNEDNSPLLSNIIMDIAIDPKTGIVYIGTEKGLIAYRGEATGGVEQHEDVLVFPNPVREDYNGPIAIRGLVDDASVKITDVRGILMYQTQAYGGQAIWDGKDYNGVRASTGVYLVFSTNEDGKETFVTKLLFIN